MPDWNRSLAALARPRGLLSLALTVAALVYVIWPVFRWAVLDAQFSGDARSCRAAAGACWAFIAEKLPFLVYGFQVSNLAWPVHLFALLAAAKIGLLLALPAQGLRAFFPMLALQAVAIVLVTMPGLVGATELSGRWSGFLLTLSLMLDGLPLALGVGILMALARNARSAFLRVPIGFLVDACRAIPLVAILFFAAVVVPSFLGEALTPAKLVRGWLTFVLFAACYFCEAVRGGLAAIPQAQGEAAAALGLRPWQIAALVRLPQALRTAWPGITSNLVAFTKDSSLISIIGVTELFSALKFSLSDPQWLGFVIEGYVFVGLVYFALCQMVILWSRRIEHRFGIGRSP